MLGWLIMGLVATTIVLDALKLRGRLSTIRPLPPSQAGGGEAYTLVTAPNVVLPAKIEAAARAWAQDQDLKVLHLVPNDCTTPYLLTMSALTDPQTMRESPIAVGGAPGQAVLVHPSVADRVEPPTGSDPGSFLAYERRLKPYAGRAMDYVSADFTQAGRPFTGRGTLEVGMPGARIGLVLGIVLSWLIVLSGFLWAPIPATVAFLAWLGHSLIAISGTVFRPQDLMSHSALRPFADLASLPRLLAARSDGQNPIEDRRAKYQSLLAKGTEPFFRTPETQCYICGAETLKTAFTMPDFYQGKPGRFRMDRCTECGHVCQNPQLNLDGLNLYYADFYDGLGEAQMETMFAAPFQPYADRAQMILAADPNPRRWLDVGCGHGHFACIARDEVPGCRFEGLDLSESVEEAEQRGWIDRAWRGLFPEMTTALESPYDVVSMSHYLEHTIDPRSELSAAHQVLRPDGHLFIEVPDPTGVFARLLGRFWMPWFQPQHLHLISPRNLERLLGEAGFEPISWHHREAHTQIDFALGAFNFARFWIPTLRAPWVPKPSLGRTIGIGLGWMLISPILIIGGLLDLIFTPISKIAGWSSTYRVLSRRIEAKI